MTITPQNDPIPENNRAVSFLEVTGGNGVLLLSGYDRDPLAPFLEAQGFRVQQPSGLNRLDARHLSGVGLVIINNLSASSVPPDFLHALDYYVREQGRRPAHVRGAGIVLAPAATSPPPLTNCSPFPWK